MWTKDYSVRLSVFFTRLFFVILGLGVLFVPRLVRLFVYYSGKESWLSIALPAAFYLCVPLAGVVLWSLERLLAGLSRGEIFTGENTCGGSPGAALGWPGSAWALPSAFSPSCWCPPPRPLWG